MFGLARIEEGLGIRLRQGLVSSKVGQKLLGKARCPVVKPDVGSCQGLLLLPTVVLFGAVAPNQVTQAPDLCDSTGCESLVTIASSHRGCGLSRGCPFPTCTAGSSADSWPRGAAALIPSLPLTLWSRSCGMGSSVLDGAPREDSHIPRHEVLGSRVIFWFSQVAGDSALCRVCRVCVTCR